MQYKINSNTRLREVSGWFNWTTIACLVAARLYDKWWLFDPTWAAGTVKDNRFTGRFSNRFYKLLPEEMIKDHMPFDPLYQFLYYPVTSQEFYDGKTTINSSKKFSVLETAWRSIVLCL